MATVKALMVGDVVGDPGLAALEALLPGVVAEFGIDFVVVNGENAAAGFGLTEPTLKRILAAGADVVTSGNHVWEKREFWPTLGEETRVLRPANYPAGAVGHGIVSIKKAGLIWAVMNLQGREGMTPIDCPFACADLLLSGLEADIALLDFHAESTEEKEAFAFYLDGRIGAVVGTHTHVQTADARLLPKGTAYVTDLGMTGVTNGVIGMDAKNCAERCRTQVPYRMECSMGPSALHGVTIIFDADTRKPVSIEALRRNLS